GTRGHTRDEGCRRLCVRRWYQRGRRAADGRRRRHRHERDLPADQGVRRRLLCPGTPVARSRRPMGREDRQSLPLLAGTPRVRVRPRELTGEVAARCERGGPFCIYLFIAMNFGQAKHLQVLFKGKESLIRSEASASANRALGRSAVTDVWLMF